MVGFPGLLLSVLGAGRIEFHEILSQPLITWGNICPTWGDHPLTVSAPHVAEGGSVV